MRALNFKRALQLAAAAMFTLTLLILAACGEDEPKADPVTVQFPSNGSITLGEEDDATTINISLSSAATKDGTITITASGNAAGALGFDTEITVTKGNTVAILHINPADNNEIDGGKVVTLTISDVTSGFEIGEQDTYIVNITDDEGPTEANFETGSGEVAENASGGIEVTILLSSPADVAGTVVVAVDPSTATITTVPAISDGTITIPVAVDAEEVSFVVTPVNGTDDNADYDVKFTITGATGGVEVGTSVEYVLTVDDDDDIVITSIADVRAMYASSDVSITTDTYIQGVVTSVSGSSQNVHQNGMYIQDESGAILIYFADAHEKARGTEVMVNLNGSTLTSYNGLLELSGTAIAKITDVGTGTLPEPKLITVAELTAGTYESQLVTLQNVSFPDADGIITMNGSKTLSDGTNTSVVFTRSAASFQNQVVPLGSGTVTGIVSDFNGIQLLPQVFSEDIFESNPVGTIDITGTLADFGSVNNGQESVSQSFTVNGVTLTQSITVTASANYLVSSNNIDFTATASLPSTGGTVYVKFAPTSGADQAIAGTITHKSQGAVSVVVNVTGTEAGNGASALQTLALWTFETSIPTTAGPHNAEGGILAGSTAQALGFHVSSSTAYSNPAGNGTSESFSSNYWDTNDYYQFSLNSTGYSDINISWDQTRSGSGPSAFALYYSTDGTNFTKHADYTVVEATGGWSSGTPKTGTSYTYDLSAITGLNDAATLVFRLVHTGSGISTNGTNRVDSVKIEGR